MALRVSHRGVAFVGRFEGFIPCARDIGDGVWTVGHGTTSATGRDIHPGLCISLATADKWLRQDLNHDYLSHIPKRWRMKQRELDALASFAYNLGPGAVGDPSFSTLARRLASKEGRTYAKRERIYREEMPRWIEKGSQFEEGLRRRRAAEVRLATTGHYH